MIFCRSISFAGAGWIKVLAESQISSRPRKVVSRRNLFALQQIRYLRSLVVHFYYVSLRLSALSLRVAQRVNESGCDAAAFSAEHRRPASRSRFDEIPTRFFIPWQPIGTPRSSLHPSVRGAARLNCQRRVKDNWHLAASDPRYARRDGGTAR